MTTMNYCFCELFERNQKEKNRREHIQYRAAGYTIILMQNDNIELANITYKNRVRKKNK